MTIEINDTEDFSRKLAHFFAAVGKLEKAGFEQSPDLFESLTEDFLTQFEATTMARVEPNSAGFIVVMPGNGTIPFDFKGHLYGSRASAELGIQKFLVNKDYGKVSDYRIVEATYFA